MVLMNMPKVNILLEDREDGKDGSLFGLNLLLGISLGPFEGWCATLLVATLARYARSGRLGYKLSDFALQA
jgi:hypothetical protein